MQWDWLKTFETVARLGSLTAAAKALKVSQSTVSRHVGHLEEHAGSPLLLRQSPIQLTQRGAALADAIKPMVDAALNARATLEETQELHGEVVVANVVVVAIVKVVVVATLMHEQPAALPYRRLCPRCSRHRIRTWEYEIVSRPCVLWLPPACAGPRLP